MRREKPKDPIISEIVKYDADLIYYAEILEIEDLNQRYGIVKKGRDANMKALPAKWVKLHLYSLDEEELFDLLKYLKSKS